MPVLVITPWWGGFVQTQVELMEDAGLEVRVARMWLTRGPRLLVAAVAVIQGLRLAFTERPRVVHCYSAWPAGIAGTVAAVCHSAKVLIHEHLSPASRLAELPFVRVVMENADRVLSPSLSHADALQLLFHRPVSVVANPVDAVPGRKLVLCIGRMEEQKGFDLAVEVARKMPSDTFLFVGDGSQRKALEQSAGTNCLFMGAVPRAAALALMESASVVFCPSRHESFGLVAAEAAALGTPVVATMVGSQGMVAHGFGREAAPIAIAALLCDVAGPRERIVVRDFSPRAFTERIKAAHSLWEE
jgi:glycosyltransferase involved in cell wall biosynthesis